MEDVKSRPESNPSCPNCAKLETLLAQALGRIAELEARVAELERLVKRIPAAWAEQREKLETS